MKKKQLRHRSPSRKGFSWGWLAAIFIGFGILTYSFRDSLPFFQTASINKIIEEDPSLATTDAEKEAIDDVNEAAQQESRYKTDSAKHQEAVKKLYITGEKLSVVRDIQKDGGTVAVSDLKTGGTIEKKAVGNLKNPPPGGNNDGIATLDEKGNLTPEAYLPVSDATGTKKPDLGTTGASCGGSFTDIPAGYWAPTGYGLRPDGSHCNGSAGEKCEQRECAYCSGRQTDSSGPKQTDTVGYEGYARSNGKLVTKSCGDIVKEDPRKVIMPPDPGAEYWTQSNGTVAPQPQKSCTSPSGPIPSGNKDGSGKYCSNGAWVDESKYIADEQARCDASAGGAGKSKFNVSTGRCDTIAQKPATPTLTGEAACKAKSGYHWAGALGCVKGMAAGSKVNSPSDCTSGDAIHVYVNSNEQYYKCTGGANGDVVTDPGYCASGYASRNSSGDLVCSSCKAGANPADKTGSSYYTCDGGKAVYHSCGQGAYVSNGSDGKCVSKTYNTPVTSTTTNTTPTQPTGDGKQIGGTTTNPDTCKYGTTSQYASRGLWACNMSAKGTITSGSKCTANDDNNSCASGECSYVTAPGSSRRDWYCMATDIGNNNQAPTSQYPNARFLSNGTWCDNSSNCQSGYCADYIGFDKCANNPFTTIPTVNLISNSTWYEKIWQFFRELFQ